MQTPNNLWPNDNYFNSFRFEESSKATAAERYTAIKEAAVFGLGDE
jgi:hypothetical protein